MASLPVALLLFIGASTAADNKQTCEFRHNSQLCVDPGVGTVLVTEAESNFMKSSLMQSKSRPSMRHSIISQRAACDDKICPEDLCSDGKERRQLEDKCCVCPTADFCVGKPCTKDLCRDGRGRRQIGDDCCACPELTPATCRDCLAQHGTWQVGTCHGTHCPVAGAPCYYPSHIWDACKDYEEDVAAPQQCSAAGITSSYECHGANTRCMWSAQEHRCFFRTLPTTCRSCLAVHATWQVGICHQTYCPVAGAVCYYTSDTWDACDAYEKEVTASQQCSAASHTSCKECQSAGPRCMWSTTESTCFTRPEQWSNDVTHLLCKEEEDDGDEDDDDDADEDEDEDEDEDGHDEPPYTRLRAF